MILIMEGVESTRLAQAQVQAVVVVVKITRLDQAEQLEGARSAGPCAVELKIEFVT